MKLEEQVCSLELAKRLKELGVKQDSIFWWRNTLVSGESYVSHWEGPTTSQHFSAFTVAELGEMLPPHLQIDKYQSSKYLWSVNWTDMRRAKHSEKADTEADARAKMLLYLLENNLIDAVTNGGSNVLEEKEVTCRPSEG